MVHGYHVVLPMYGFWLPNDPRGSWSDFVRRWEIARFGAASKTIERRSLAELTAAERQSREEAKQQLKYPAVCIAGDQARTIGNGFAKYCAKCNYTIWACSILPEHTHLILARHTYKVEQMVNLLKGAATTACIVGGNHPLQNYAKVRKRPPRMWATRLWKQFLDSEEAIMQAIRYVEENPLKEGKPLQKWNFITPFAGINTSGWTTYH